jgi:hypothetical protein
MNQDIFGSQEKVRDFNSGRNGPAPDSHLILSIRPPSSNACDRADAVKQAPSLPGAQVKPTNGAQ